MPMDDKTREEVRGKLQEVRVLVEQMQVARKRQTRLMMIAYGLIIGGLSFYARGMASYWLAVVTDPKTIDTLNGIATMSQLMLVFAAIMVAFGIIGEDRLERWLEKLLGKPAASEGNHELPK